MFHVEIFIQLLGYVVFNPLRVQTVSEKKQSKLVAGGGVIAALGSIFSCYAPKPLSARRSTAPILL